MIYYICIISKVSIIDLGQLAKTCIDNHTVVKNSTPNILNEACVFMAIDDKNALKKLSFTEKDEVRLALYRPNSYSYHSFSMNDFSDIKEIFDTLVNIKVMVNETVVYV